MEETFQKMLPIFRKAANTPEQISRADLTGREESCNIDLHPRRKTLPSKHAQVVNPSRNWSRNVVVASGRSVSKYERK
jgi:hypothetical protein